MQYSIIVVVDTLLLQKALTASYQKAAFIASWQMVIMPGKRNGVSDFVDQEFQQNGIVTSYFLMPARVPNQYHIYIYIYPQFIGEHSFGKLEDILSF